MIEELFSSKPVQTRLKELDGVLYAVVKRRNGGANSIIVQCPICGEWGRLARKAKKMVPDSYSVFHKNGRCAVSWFSDGWEILDAIYRRERDETSRSVHS